MTTHQLFYRIYCGLSNPSTVDNSSKLIKIVSYIQKRKHNHSLAVNIISDPTENLITLARLATNCEIFNIEIWFDLISITVFHLTVYCITLP